MTEFDPNQTDRSAGPEASGDDAVATAEPNEAEREEHEATAAALRAELEETKNRLLRTAAEFQNFRRRTEEEKRLWAQAGREEVVSLFLDVYDDFRRSLEAASQTEAAEGSAEADGIVRGISLIYDKFSDAMKKLRVEPIETVGRPFDPDVHHALMRQPASEDFPPDTVAAEVQRGYRMGDRVLRHPQVVVAQ